MLLNTGLEAFTEALKLLLPRVPRKKDQNSFKKEVPIKLHNVPVNKNLPFKNVNFFSCKFWLCYF